jgi:hypothetical protein
VSIAELPAREARAPQARLSDAELRRLIEARLIAWRRIVANTKTLGQMDPAERFAFDADSRMYCSTEASIVAELRQRENGEIRHKGRRWLVVGNQLVSRPNGDRVLSGPRSPRHSDQGTATRPDPIPKNRSAKPERASSHASSPA